MQRNDRPVSIDLFAGAGGLSLGLEAAGFATGLAVEKDRWAAQTFAANFPMAEVLEADLEDISDDEISSWSRLKPTLIAGGPPCQGFSHSNVVNHDAHDPRNSLFRQFIRFVAILRPRYCLIENVTGLLKTRTAHGDRVIDIIRDELSSHDYEVSWRVLQAVHFGVPQNRERLFILGVRRPDCASEFQWPDLIGGVLIAPPVPPVPLWDAISDLPEGEDRYTTEPTNAYQRLMRKNWRGTSPSLHEPMRHTSRLVERFKRIGYGQDETSVSSDFGPQKRGRLEHGRAYSQNNRRQLPDMPCNTIVASSHTNYLHPFYHRNFTVRELMRIQSFPDDFILRGKRAVLSRSLSLKKGLLDDVFLDQRMQIGNAVPPLLAKALGACLFDVVQRSTEVSNAA